MRKEIETLVKKYWKIILIATILIFMFIPLDLVINQKAIVETKELYMETLTEEGIEDIASFADTYLTNVVQTKLYSQFNIITLLLLPVILSVQLIGDIKEQKFTKSVFLTQAFLVIAPFLINTIVLMCVKAIEGVDNYLSFVDIGKWFGVSVMVSLLISAIADFIGLFTNKNKVLHFCSTYVALFMPAIIVMGMEQLCKILIYGFGGYSSTFSNILLEWPGIKVFSLFTYNYAYEGYLSNFSLIHVVVYAIIIALFIYGIYKFSSKQRTYKFVSYAILYSFVILITLLFASAIAQLSELIVAILVALGIAGIVFILGLLFIKEKNVKKIAYGYGIYSLAMVAIVFIINGCMGGFEKYTPNVDEVEYAIFSNADPSKYEAITFYERENVEYIINMHKEIAENKDIKYSEDKMKFYIQYVLKNGEVINRQYSILPKYEEIYDSYEYIKQRYSYIIDEELRNTLTKVAIRGLYDNIEFEIEYNRDDEAFEEILSAIESDIIEKNVYRIRGDEYNLYAEKEGVQLIGIDISIDRGTAEEYLLYINPDSSCKLVQIINNLVDIDSGKIIWEEVKE